MTDIRKINLNLNCSFCGKSQREVRKLIAGPTVYICDECLGLCNTIMDEEKVRDATARHEEVAESAVEPAVCFSGLIRGYSDEQAVLTALSNLSTALSALKTQHQLIAHRFSRDSAAEQVLELGSDEPG